MIVVSLLLILVAVTLLVLGLAVGSSILLISSIVASLLAAVALVIGARQAAARRRQNGVTPAAAEPSARGGFRPRDAAASSASRAGAYDKVRSDFSGSDTILAKGPPRQDRRSPMADIDDDRVSAGPVSPAHGDGFPSDSDDAQRSDGSDSSGVFDSDDPDVDVPAEAGADDAYAAAGPGLDAGAEPGRPGSPARRGQAQDFDDDLDYDSASEHAAGSGSRRSSNHDADDRDPGFDREPAARPAVQDDDHRTSAFDRAPDDGRRSDFDRAPDFDRASSVIGAARAEDDQSWRRDPEAGPPGARSTGAADFPDSSGDSEEFGEPDEDDPADEPLPQAIRPGDAVRVARMDAEVLVVDGRPRYHLADCRHLVGRLTEGLPAGEAVELGFSPCGLCRPVDRLVAQAAHR